MSIPLGTKRSDSLFGRIKSVNRVLCSLLTYLLMVSTGCLPGTFGDSAQFRRQSLIVKVEEIEKQVPVSSASVITIPVDYYKKKGESAWTSYHGFDKHSNETISDENGLAEFSLQWGVISHWLRPEKGADYLTREPYAFRITDAQLEDIIECPMRQGARVLGDHFELEIVELGNPKVLD